MEGERLSGAAQHARQTIQRPPPSLGRRGSAERKEDVISGPASFQGPGHFYVLRSQGSPESGWEPGRHTEYPAPPEFWEHLHRRQA